MRSTKAITIVLLIAFNITAGIAQFLPQPVAKFTFDNQSKLDEISHTPVKMVTTRFTRDRFGNKDHAAYVFGDPYSYINLGTNPKMKPRSGSISLWVSIDHDVWSGWGYVGMPILLTKSTTNNDFYESYCIFYSMENRKLGVSSARDSLRQVVTLSLDTARFGRWYHLGIAFDDDHISFYVDGELINKSQKHFPTLYLSSDSVLVGVTNNMKNSRYLRGSVDDIQFFDVVLTPEQMLALYNAPDPNKSSIYLKYIRYALGFLILIAALLFYTRRRLNQLHRREKEKLELQNVMLETELRVNRALMNPHFVFNSLNTLQNFILKNENENAHKYLVRFSKLMRQVLESNLANTITLDTEIEMLQRYLEIEDMRFEDDIRHELVIDPEIKPSSTRIPIMMIQPFVENAIWHGLLKKPGNKKLKISFDRVGSIIRCVIDDNGNGRKKAEDDSTEYKKSLAISFIEQRLDLMNRIHNLNCGLEIHDKPNGGGTTVCIDLPILN